MTLGWNYLNDIATQRFTESPSIEGGQNLHEITERARAEISRRAYPLLAVTLVSMLIFAGNLFCAAWELVDLEEYEHFTYGVFGRFSAYIFPTFQNLLVCVIIGTSSFLMIYLMQHREPFKSWLALSKSCHPETLESLFDDLQNKTWQAKNNEGRLPVYLFSSAWRTLLAAGPEAKFLQTLVWDKRGKAYKGDREIKPLTVENENRSIHGGHNQDLSNEDKNEDISANYENASITKHWRSSVPPESRDIFCTTFAALGGWQGEDAIKVKIVLQAVFSYDGQVGDHNGKEKLGPLVGAGKAALRHALNNGQIQTLWLSDNRKPDPHASIEKMLGDLKTHKYTKTRIKTFEVLGISLG